MMGITDNIFRDLLKQGSGYKFSVNLLTHLSIFGIELETINEVFLSSRSTLFSHHIPGLDIMKDLDRFILFQACFFLCLSF